MLESVGAMRVRALKQTIGLCFIGKLNKNGIAARSTVVSKKGGRKPYIIIIFNASCFFFFFTD